MVHDDKEVKACWLATKPAHSEPASKSIKAAIHDELIQRHLPFPLLTCQIFSRFILCIERRTYLTILCSYSRLAKEERVPCLLEAALLESAQFLTDGSELN